jgi:hypothetical protein
MGNDSGVIQLKVARLDLKLWQGGLQSAICHATQRRAEETVSKATGTSIGWKSDATWRAFQCVLNIGARSREPQLGLPDMKGTALSKCRSSLATASHV